MREKGEKEMQRWNNHARRNEVDEGRSIYKLEHGVLR